MELDENLVAALRCPEAGQKLAIAPDEILEALNERIAGGGISNQGGKTLAEPVSAGLLREDGALLYPIDDGFPILLIDAAIEVSPG